MSCWLSIRNLLWFTMEVLCIQSQLECSAVKVQGSTKQIQIQIWLPISTFISCASSITKPAEDVLISNARPSHSPSSSPDPVAYREPRNRHGRQKTIELMTWLWTVGIAWFGSGSGSRLGLGLGLVGALLFIRLCARLLACFAADCPKWPVRHCYHTAARLMHWKCC